MLKDVQPITEREMLLDWGRAEADTYVRNGWPLPPELEQRAIAGDVLSRADERQIIARITTVRAGMICGLLHVDLDWGYAEIGVSDLSKVGVVDIPEFRSATTIEELAERLPEMRKENFDPTRMRGHPIIIGPSVNGPFQLIEGTTRSCEILRMHRAGRFPSTHVRGVAGVGDAVQQWFRWRR